MAPFGPLTYVYVGSSDTKADLAFYTTVLGGDMEWEFHGFGAHVAAVRLGDGPLFLLADHRPPKSTIFIYRVDDLAAEQKRLAKRGWKKTSDPVEVPDGPVLVLHDPTGNEIGLLEQVRPNALTKEYQREHQAAQRQPRSK
jgi:predicted enzyme related to lactoylglutathione lyase